MNLYKKNKLKSQITKKSELKNDIDLFYDNYSIKRFI